MYYLQSRYYNPKIGRFLNHDIVFDYDAGLQGHDLFACCGNNPVNRIDISGADSCELQSKEDLLDKEETEGGISTGGQYKQSNTNYAGQQVSTYVNGSGHGSPAHSSRINSHISKLVNSGNYSEVYGNRALSTAGLNGSQRPDIIAIGRDGVVEVWEYASMSQATGTSGHRALEAKIQLMQLANPNAIFHAIVPWEGVCYK